ncbi:MAG TPA: serine/threonine-protein kinase, partial [Anaerolineaceae bacterium]|nr:serine/threonine-protein kinase [Anaerolineaceae bacterium]
MTEEIKLGKYKIIKELGRGGFGIVYEAHDTILGRDVALKVLHSQHAVDRGFIERFGQEARMAAQLEHPHLVPVYDFNEINGRYIIVMGLMKGGSLKDQIKRYGAFDTFRAKKVLEQILEGIHFIHQNDVVHRDIKPSNILFDQHGTARISDLGFAKALRGSVDSSMSVSGGLVGTPAYMAPEVWHGKKATEQSDIYSLGCIIYEMLTGERLFYGETPAESMTKHLIVGPQMDAD